MLRSTKHLRTKPIAALPRYRDRVGYLDVPTTQGAVLVASNGAIVCRLRHVGDRRVCCASGWGRVLKVSKNQGYSEYGGTIPYVVQYNAATGRARKEPTAQQEDR